MLMKIMHINHSLNCTILNLQFVPVRRLYRLLVNRFSKPGTSSSFTAANRARPVLLQLSYHVYSNTGQLGIWKEHPGTTGQHCRSMADL